MNNQVNKKNILDMRYSFVLIFLLLVSAASLFKYLDDHKVIAQTHHTGWGYDMRMRYPDEIKMIETYLMHGLSELYDNETPLSMGSQRHRGGGEKDPSYARDA
jgi:hypothetical protein